METNIAEGEGTDTAEVGVHNPYRSEIINLLLGRGSSAVSNPNERNPSINQTETMDTEQTSEETWDINSILNRKPEASATLTTSAGENQPECIEEAEGVDTIEDPYTPSTEADADFEDDIPDAIDNDGDKIVKSQEAEESDTNVVKHDENGTGDINHSNNPDEQLDTDLDGDENKSNVSEPTDHKGSERDGIVEAEQKIEINDDCDQVRSGMGTENSQGVEATRKSSRKRKRKVMAGEDDETDTDVHIKVEKRPSNTESSEQDFKDDITDPSAEGLDDKEELKCPVCEELTPANILPHHMAEVHGQHSYVCHYCGTVEDSSAQLKVHMRLKHGNSKRQASTKVFSCEECPYTTKFIATFRRHGDSHKYKRGELKKSVQCEVCDRSFVNAANLKTHMITHRDAKPYQCSICSQEFAQKNNLKIHEAKHNKQSQNIDGSGDNGNQGSFKKKLQFACDECGKMFRWKHDMKRHKKTVHLGIKKFPCQHCDKQYTDKSALNIHNSNHHLHEQNFSCSFCSRKFFNKYRLAAHLRSSHKAHVKVKELLIVVEKREAADQFDEIQAAENMFTPSVEAGEVTQLTVRDDGEIQAQVGPGHKGTGQGEVTQQVTVNDDLEPCKPTEMEQALVKDNDSYGLLVNDADVRDNAVKEIVVQPLNATELVPVRVRVGGNGVIHIEDGSLTVPIDNC